MMMKIKNLLVLTCSVCISCFASHDGNFDQSINTPDQDLTPEQIHKEIVDAQKEFDEARKMFNPWYAGPLLTASPHVLPPELYNIQPYLFVTTNYGSYTRSGSTINTPNRVLVNPVIIFQKGIIKAMDAILTVQGVSNHQSGEHSTNFGDTALALAFAMRAETPYLPAFLFAVRESFPTGKYKKLNPNKNGVDASGSGSFETKFSLNTGKVVWWISTHPMNLRLSLNYTIPSMVRVKGFNAYGGGYGTRGKVRPGNSFEADFGYEFSVTQKWVLACDVIYSYTSGAQFSGRAGVNADGTPAVTGGNLFNDTLSLAPAIEYNVNANLGFLLGGWASVWGRNSSQFASGIFTFTYTF